MNQQAPFPIPELDISGMVQHALLEDIGSGDVTAALIPADKQIQGRLISRENAVLCGSKWFDEVFRQLDPNITIQWQAKDGDRLTANQVLCRMQGPARAILSGERSALNFLQSLSGIATQARTYADAVAGTHTKILDTRKTIPGLRLAQKYAVRCGGCHNHRLGLYDAILIKENHIAAAGSISLAVQTARQLAAGIFLEVEVETLEQLEEAITAGVDRVLLDNFNSEQMRVAVQQTQGRVPLEASGNISLETIKSYADTGVDFISIGALTKHLRAIDLSLRLE